MDRIEKITIENYKSIDHCSIDNCNEINLLVGPPNSGKSNIIENLSLFTLPIFDSRKTKKIKLKDIIRFGDKLDLFKSSADEILKANTSLIKKNNLQINLELKLNTLRGNSKDNILDFKFEFEQFLLLKTAEIVKLSYDFNSSFKVEINEFNDHKNYRSGTFVKYYKFIESIKSINLENESLTPYWGENLGEVIYFNEDLQKYIQKELQKIGMSLSIIKNDKTPKAQLTDKNGVSLLFDFYMLADTFQRIVFYKAAILSNKENILLFEEPEAHCYEPYMIDFVNDILNSGNDNQYFIVTHSDFILQEFLRDEENRYRTNIYMIKNEPNQGTKVKLIEKENKDVYNYGMNVFFNFDSLWEETKN